MNFRVGMNKKVKEYAITSIATGSVGAMLLGLEYKIKELSLRKCCYVKRQEISKSGVEMLVGVNCYGCNKTERIDFKIHQVLRNFEFGINIVLVSTMLFC